MKRIDIKPEHQAELKYLFGEMYRLQRMDAAAEVVARGLKKLADRQLALYPELGNTLTCMDEDATHFLVYTDLDEYIDFLKKTEAAQKEAPFVAEHYGDTFLARLPKKGGQP